MQTGDNFTIISDSLVSIEMDHAEVTGITEWKEVMFHELPPLVVAELRSFNGKKLRITVEVIED